MFIDVDAVLNVQKQMLDLYHYFSALKSEATLMLKCVVFQYVFEIYTLCVSK